MGCKSLRGMYHSKYKRLTWLNRLDGLVPNTPGTAKLNRSAGPKRKEFESPSVSRIKGNVPGSSPSSRTPVKMEDIDSTNAAQ